ncbi:MAG TPA: PH domain-containing protein [Chloroflexota bacterium]
MDGPAPVEEREIWRGSPSQWINFRAYLVSGLLALIFLAGLAWLSSAGPASTGGLQPAATIALAALLVVVLVYALKRYLDVRCRLYEITDQRVRLTRGILSKRSDGLELYRVDDTQLLQPFLLRVVSRGNLRLVTSDRTNPTMVIEAVPNARWLWDETRRAVEACRDRKRTRVIDFEEGDAVVQG